MNICQTACKTALIAGCVEGYWIYLLKNLWAACSSIATAVCMLSVLSLLHSEPLQTAANIWHMQNFSMLQRLQLDLYWTHPSIYTRLYYSITRNPRANTLICVLLKQLRVLETLENSMSGKPRMRFTWQGENFYFNGQVRTETTTNDYVITLLKVGKLVPYDIRLQTADG